MAITNLRELANYVATNTTLQEKLQANPVVALQEVADGAGIPNTDVYKIVVAALGLTVLIALVGAIALAFLVKDSTGKSIETPAIVTALGSAAVGALAGLLAPTPRVG
jgi:uncharacterized integral membrane protein